MSDEPKSLEMRVALIVAEAMQAAILVWREDSVQNMTESGSAKFMASLTRVYADRIMDIVAQQNDTKSSS
jgi:hypothetical protein